MQGHTKFTGTDTHVDLEYELVPVIILCLDMPTCTAVYIQLCHMHNILVHVHTVVYSFTRDSLLVTHDTIVADFRNCKVNMQKGVCASYVDYGRVHCST